MVADVPAAHSFDVLTWIQEELIVSFDAVGVRSPLIEATGETEEDHGDENSGSSGHVESCWCPGKIANWVLDESEHVTEESSFVSFVHSFSRQSELLQLPVVGFTHRSVHHF